MLSVSCSTHPPTVDDPQGCRVWPEGPAVLVSPGEHVSVILAQQFQVVSEGPAQVDVDRGVPRAVRRLGVRMASGRTYSEFRAERIGRSVIRIGRPGTVRVPAVSVSVRC